MKTIVVGSTHKSAGKTSLIVGLAKAAGKASGYIKPLGDRLLYRKKRLWDYDAALVANVFGLEDNPEEMTIGFEHAKLKYMYDADGMKDKLNEMLAAAAEGKDLVFIEGGESLSYGSSLNLDAVAIASLLNARLVLVAGGSEGTIVDDIAFLKRYVDLKGTDFAGVIINKVRNVEDYKSTHLADVIALGVNVLGVVPFEGEMTKLSVGHLSERLLAKVVAGEQGLDQKVNAIMVGAMSTNAALQNPLFKKDGKLVITGGDRTDLVLASIESNTAGIILTNNVLPPSNIVSKAQERGIPLLLVPFDTYQTASQIESIDPLLTKDDTRKMEIITQMVKEHVSLSGIVD
ncbi:MAG TPA: phosphotransacetylase family protein [Dehalococcoidia bacterium]|nr:phosphotransacetylase family protein [Dehalococcoidia bacterium]